MTTVDPQTPVPPEPQSLKADTTYVILERTKPVDPTIAGESWQKVGQVSGRTAEAAIKKHAEGVASTGAAVFLAIPDRSWRPVKVTPKVATTLVIEEA